MGVFDTATKKIINFLGMTALGQKTKTNSIGVTLASDESTLPVSDAGGSLTVDSTQLPSSLGQKAKAASMGVTLASDEDILPVSVAAGSDVTEGNTSDAAIITDTTGTVNGKLRGLVKWAFERMPPGRGPRLESESLSIVLASDIGAINVTASPPIEVDVTGTTEVISSQLPDTLGQHGKVNSTSVTLATDEPLFDRLPASLGQKGMADSLPVVMADDQTAIQVIMNGEATGAMVPLDRYDYGAVYGNLVDGDLIAGKTYDWYAIRSANDGNPTDTLTTDANVAKYFQGGHASMDTTPIWIYIPINATDGSLPNLYGGWRTFSAAIRNYLNVDLAVTLYAVPIKTLFAFGVPKKPIGDAWDFWQIATDTLASGTMKCFGPNGTTLNAGYDMPIGWLVIKAVPATDPNTGYWALSVRRSS